MFISCEETKSLIKNKEAQFVDVRTKEEFLSSQLPGAVNIPLQETDQVYSDKLDKNKPVIVFCRSGHRSHIAMQILINEGFENVHNMGPYTAWYQCSDES